MEEIKEIRLVCGLKQSELAAMLGCNQGNYSSIENGNLVPKKNTLEFKQKAKEVLKPYLEFKINQAKLSLERLEEIKNKYY